MKHPQALPPSTDLLRYLRSAVTPQIRPVATSTRLIRQKSCTLSADSPRTFAGRLHSSEPPHKSDRHISSSSPRASDLPTNPQTHYDFFPTTLPKGPPPSGSFAVDLKQLRNEFLRLQASAHPDRHPPERKAVAEALSARINEAYKTLQSPLARAQYLLSMRGNESPTDEAAKLGDEGDDQMLLMEVLDLREQIEEAETEADIRSIKEENDVRIATSVKILEDAFRSDQIDEAAKEAVKLRYWVNVDETLHAWEEGRPPPNLQH